MPAIVGQVRLAGISGAVTGIDMAAVFALAAAQGYDVRAMAVLLPAIEAGLVKAFNARSDDARGDSPARGRADSDPNEDMG